MTTDLQRHGSPPSLWDTRGGYAIHQTYSYRAIGRTEVGAALVTAWCGAVAYSGDVKPHGIGPTCKRCKDALRTGSEPRI